MPYGIINPSRSNVGLVGVCLVGAMIPRIKYKVFTLKENSPEYHYNLTNDLQWLPFSHGDGKYSVKIYEEVSPNTDKYTQKMQQEINVRIQNPHDVFLQSNVYMAWKLDMNCIADARVLVHGLKTDKEKVEAIWDYMINNFKYDYNLANEITKNGGKYNYTPDIETISKEKTSICFGLTALFNSMVRSQKIAAKMVHGYFGNNYHAWSEIFVENGWKRMDVTLAIGGVVSTDNLSYTDKFIY